MKSTIFRFATIAENDGFFRRASGSKDSALFVNLGSGVDTVQLGGEVSISGRALVEIFEVS